MVSTLQSVWLRVFVFAICFNFVSWVMHCVGFSLEALCEVGVQLDFVRVMLGEFDGVWIGVHIEIRPCIKVREFGHFRACVERFSEECSV